MRRRAYAAALIVVLAVVLDTRRTPSDQWLAAAAVAGIHLYQSTLSPVYARAGVRCRFTVSCSHYGEEAIRKYGVARGGYLAAARILRCGPWTPAGSVDSVP